MVSLMQIISINLKHCTSKYKMSVKITYESDNLKNKFDLDLFIPNKNVKKEILELIFLNKIKNMSKVKYTINVDELCLHTYNMQIVNQLLNKLIV